MTRSKYAVRPAVAPRKWLAVLVLLSFFFQSLAVQTHIHPQLPQTAAKVAHQGTSAPAPVKNQDPMDQCRLCQELVHAGHFVAPSALAAFASLSLVAAIFATPPDLLDRSAPAFAWQSRAPPRR
jgi:hypothetical protein